MLKLPRRSFVCLSVP